jgi:hypothetical protein
MLKTENKDTRQMQIQITLDHNDNLALVAQVLAGIAFKNGQMAPVQITPGAPPAPAVEAPAPAVEAPATEAPAAEDAAVAAEPEKKKAGRPAKAKEPEKPAPVDAIACREVLKKVAAKAGQGDAQGGIAKVEELLGQFNVRRISELQPDQWGPFVEICDSYLKS